MSRVWAVARTLIREIVRMRILMAFIILLFVCYTGGLALWLHGTTAPANEKVQTFLGYSLRMAGWFLSLLTIFLAIATITRDIERKEVFTIATKPVSRWQFLVGKFLGLAVFNLVLVLVNGGMVYGLARLMAVTEPTTKVEEVRLRELVLTARESVKPPLPDVSAEARRMTDDNVQAYIKKNDVTDPHVVELIRTQTYAAIEQQLIMRHRAVQPGQTALWHFSGIKPRDRESGFVFIRYKQEVSTNPPDLALDNQWRVGPRDPSVHGGSYLRNRGAIRTPHEFALPVEMVSPDGDLYVEYGNVPTNAPATVIFPTDFGIEALYVAGTFEANMARAMGLIYIRLLFLGVLGLAAGAWLSFPVAVLFVLGVYFMGLSSDFILDAVKWDTAEGHAQAVRILMPLFPKLAAYDPIPNIEKGRLVSGELFAEAALFLLVIKGAIVGFVGYLIFRFRELARVIV